MRSPVPGAVTPYCLAAQTHGSSACADTGGPDSAAPAPLVTPCPGAKSGGKVALSQLCLPCLTKAKACGDGPPRGHGNKPAFTHS